MNICEEMPKVFGFMGYIIDIICIIVPILLVLFGSIDLVKAIVSQKEDEIKKGYSTVFKRIIISVIIFFVPTIINLVFNLIPLNTTDSSKCFECINNPSKCMEEANVKDSETNVECTDSNYGSRDTCCKEKYNNEMIYDYKVGCVKPDIFKRGN